LAGKGGCGQTKKELCQTLYSHTQSYAELSHHAGRMWKERKEVPTHIIQHWCGGAAKINPGNNKSAPMIEKCITDNMQRDYRVSDIFSVK